MLKVVDDIIYWKWKDKGDVRCVFKNNTNPLSSVALILGENKDSFFTRCGFILQNDNIIYSYIKAMSGIAL